MNEQEGGQNTSAYWLPTMNSGNDGDDMIMTVHDKDSKLSKETTNPTINSTTGKGGIIPDTNEDTANMVDHNNNDDLHAKLAALTGAEHFLVGLTPHYWAYIPMLITDVHHLGLVNGLSCIVVRSSEQCSVHAATVAETGAAATSVQFIPVSKCTLVGVVVNVDRKSNGLTLYLIDDGTGLMDCVLWDESDYYKLPPLVDDDIGEDKARFVVGDMVRVMGSLRIVSRTGLREQTCDAAGTAWEVHDGVREIQVTNMEHIAAKTQNANPRRYCADPEHEHWVKCVEWKQRYGGKNATTIQNGVDTLRLLGPKIARHALEQSDFPSAEDDVGAWRVFGTTCQCEVPYKEALLYCHCQATVEQLDPVWTFRDAMLVTLLQLEQQLTSIEPLHFSYQRILNDQALQSIAKSIAPVSGVPFQRIFLKTFAALRNDGILHLFNRDTDQYILISRARVLEPHIQQIKRLQSNNQQQTMQPPITLLPLDRQSVLKNVPSARIYLVKRTLEKQKSFEARQSTENVKST